MKHTKFELEKKLSADFSQVNPEYYEKMFSDNFILHDYDILDVNRFLLAEYKINLPEKAILYSLYIVDQLFSNGHYANLIEFLKIAKPNRSDYAQLMSYFNKKIKEDVDRSFYEYLDILSEEFDVLYNKKLTTSLLSEDEKKYIESKYGLLEEDYTSLRDVFHQTYFSGLYASDVGYVIRDVELNTYESFQKNEIVENLRLTNSMIDDLSCIWNLKEVVRNYATQYKLNSDSERLMRIFLTNPKLVEFIYNDEEVTELTDLELNFLLKIDKLIEDIDLQNAKKSHQSIYSYEFKRIDKYLENYEVLRNAIVLEMVDEYTDDLLSIKELLSRYTKFFNEAKTKGITRFSHLKLS